MADAVLSEAVRKRRAADALNGQNDEEDTSDVQDGEAATGATKDSGETDTLAEEEAIDQEAVSAVTEEKAPSLGYRFVPVSPPAQDVPQNVPQGTPTFAVDQSTPPLPVSMASREMPRPAIRAISTQWRDFDVNPLEPPEDGVSQQDILASAGRAQQGSRAAQVPTPESEYVGIEEPAPDTLTQVERGELVKPQVEPRLSPYRDPDPDNPDYKTPLTPGQEKQFQKWVKDNKVPFDDSATSDYDMRGFWKAAQEGDPNAKTSVSKFDNRIHFTDTYKTPYHRTFSNESQYATGDAPHWVGDRLIDKDGNVVADETPRVQPAPDKLTQVERGQLVNVPPGTAPRAVAIPSPPAVKPAEPAAPSTAFLGEEGVAVTPTAPTVKRAEPVTTEPISVPTAEYTDRVQKWRAAMQAYGFDAKVKPDGTWVGVDSSGKEVTPGQNKGLYQFGARLSQQYGFSGQEEKLGQLGDAAPAAGQPAVPQGGDTGVADFYRKRGDKPITSGDDPRLSTVSVGGQTWRVNKEAAPYFQGFLNELAAKGAPVQAGEGWVYREKVGAKGISDHAFGGAIDVNQPSGSQRNFITPEFQKWIAANPGVLQQVEKRWNIYGGERFGDLGHFEWGGATFKPAAQQAAAQQAAAQQAAAQPVPPITTNPNGSDFPQRVQAVGNNDPAAFITHHTSGRGTVQGVIDTLRQRGLGVQYVMDRDGNIFATGGPGAQNILAGWGPKGTGLNNQNIVGMEVIAKDNNDVTDAQKQSFARFMAARYPNTPIYGHGEVNPGHKEEDEGQATKAAALAYRDKLSQGQVAQEPGAAPQAQPVTKQANGLYQNEKPQDFLSGPATTFATPEDIASGQDNGVGAPRLGKLDTTSVAGVAIPEEALRAKYGNNYAAWRRARVDVVDPQTGKRLRVPIVDLGPRGDMTAITDMTPTLSSYFGGDKNLMVKLVDNAGPDVTKNPQLWADEQAAIRQGFDSSTLQPGVQKIAPKLGYTFKPVVPSAEGAALQQADAFNQQNSRATIAQLPEQNQSLPALINRLDQPIEGVPDAMRRNYQQVVKDEATKYAQDYYGIKDPKEALAKIMSSPDAGTFFGEIKDKALPYLNQAVTAFNQSAVAIDQNRLDDLAKAVHPDASPEARKTFINSIISEKDPAQRAANINAIIGNLASENPNNPALAALRATDIADSADRLADPEYQKRQKDEIARQVEANTKALRPDPRLQGTAAGWWADQFAQLPKNVIEGITGPLGQSLMLSEIYQGTVTRLRQENPNMSEDELKARAEGSTLAQIVPAEVLNRLAGGKLGGLTGAIENPVQRIGLSALVHLGIGGTAGAAQQIGINVAEGGPTAEGVLQAAGAGAVQALPGVVGAVVHGAREPGTRPEGIKPAPKDEEVQPPLVTPEKPQLTTRPLSAIDVLGDEPPQTITPEQTDDVLKVVAHNVFPDLNDYEAKQVADRMAALSARNLETDRLRYELQRFLPQGVPYSFGSTTRLMQAYGAFQDGPTVYTALELQRAQDAFNAVRNPQVRAPGALKLPIMWREVEAQIPREGIQPPVRPDEGLVRPAEEAAMPVTPVTQEDVARRTYELYDERAKNGQPGTALDDYAQAQKELSRTSEPVLPGTMSEAEPINSAIANRYVQERMARGELGQIDPSQGQSTEDMVQQGLQMSPKQRDGLIDNFMKAKGGDLDQQGAAIRSKEALLSEQARAASRTANADPTNHQLQAQAKVAADAVTAFHNGPIKKFKQVWSDSGRALQREIPLDYTTFNGMKEAYLKGNNKEAPAGLEPKLKRMADAVSKTADAERVAMNNLGKEIENQTRGKTLPTDDQIRTRLMEIMKDLPCPVGAS